MSGGSTTGAWPPGPVALGVTGTCRLLKPISWLVFFSSTSELQGLVPAHWCAGGIGRDPSLPEVRVAPTLLEGSQLQPSVHHPVDSGFLRILDLLLCDPSASLLPFGAEGFRQDTCKLVGSHALEHGDKAIDAFLDCLSVVLVYVDGLGLPLVDGLRLLHGAQYRAGPLGLPSTTRAPAASRPSSTRAANHQPHDGLPDPPPDRSRGKRRRSHCRPADPPQLATLRSHEGSQLHSNLVQGHFLTRRKRLPVQHSSLCHLHDAMAVHPNKIAKVRRAKRCCGIGDEGVTSLVQSWVHQHLPTLPTLHTAVPPWKAGAAEPMPSRLVSYTMVLKRAPSAPGFEQLPIPSCPASPAVQRS